MVERKPNIDGEKQKGIKTKKKLEKNSQNQNKI